MSKKSKKQKHEPQPTVWPQFAVSYDGSNGVVSIHYATADLNLHCCVSADQVQKNLGEVFDFKKWMSVLPVLGAMLQQQEKPAPEKAKVRKAKPTVSKKSKATAPQFAGPQR